MKRIAVLSILIENANDENVMAVNKLLHEFSDDIMGRLGIPDKAHKINIISVAVFAMQDKINALSGKLGRIDGVSAKILYSNYSYEN